MNVLSTLDDHADARTGDKGDTLIVAVLPRTPHNYRHLRAHLTEQAVADHFRCDVRDVTIRDVATVESFVCELRGVLGGGVTGSPVLDGHGKTLSYHMLTLPIREHDDREGEQR
ncbi:AtuA-related protein [Corynebacterium glyciniphilum]|uniref:AtuA-related protein n=1 Tax=Corynebacterium glyciniphilum TaxID=1404244 RepID=UPI003FD20C0D